MKVEGPTANTIAPAVEPETFILLLSYAVYTVRMSFFLCSIASSILPS